MELFSIASGSSGNCICVGDDNTHVMIDAGISCKRIESGMNEMGFSTKDMAGILITHEHSDHIGGIGVLSRKYGIPIYATKGTIDAIKTKSTLGRIDEGLFHEIKADESFDVGTLQINPFKISHDAAEPVAYTINSGNKKIGVCTDLGVYSDYTVEKLKNLDALLLEANHDVHMLQVGSYPYVLKRRILGEQGHLSNELSGQLLSRILHDDMKGIFLGHLSKENNYEQLAYETVQLEVTLSDTPYSGSDFPISVAGREKVSHKIVV